MGRTILFRGRPILKFALALMLAVAGGEALIMLVIPQFGAMPNWALAVFDVGLLFLVMLPTTYAFVVVPMRRYIRDAYASEHKVVTRETQILKVLNSLAFAKDHETGHHIKRTQHYVVELARQIKAQGQHIRTLTEAHIELMRKVAPLHDIGKVGIPDAVLNKQGKLTQAERELIQTHARIGEEILTTAEQESGSDDLFAVAILVAGSHHERWDGKGYPRALSADRIPLEARIMAVVDVYDSLTSHRPYKDRWTHEQAVREIVGERGTHFDPDVVDAFVHAAPEFEKISRRLED